MSVAEEYLAVFGFLNHSDDACQKWRKYIQICQRYAQNTDVLFWDTVYITALSPASCFIYQSYDTIAAIKKS